MSTKFNDRVNEVFGSLQSLEQKHSETVATFATNEDDADDDEERVSDEESMCSQGSDNQQRKRKTTLSKCDLRRKLDNSRCQNVPNYVVNPEKWKKYRYVQVVLLRYHIFIVSSGFIQDGSSFSSLPRDLLS